MKKLIILLLFITYLFADVNIEIPESNVKKGTTFAVIFISDENMQQAPYVLYDDKSYQMFTINGSIKKYELFLPVDYYAKEGKKEFNVVYKKNDELIKKNYSVNIIDGNYKQNEIIKVAKGKVTLSEKNKERTKREYSEVYSKVYSKVSLYDLTKNESFSNPISSKITSDFGNARVYNGVTKSYHTGTDFRAGVGEEIKAMNNGKVVLVMDRFYLGKVIYIDHGRGAYSYYAHLNKALVNEGDEVTKGEVIGKSGKSGRVTGPHLHLAFRLYNITVDPLQYAQIYNNILKKYH